MNEDVQRLYQKIPKVDRLLETPGISSALQSYPKTLVMKAIHEVLDRLRTGIKEGAIEEERLNLDSVSAQVLERIEELNQPNLRRVINATGVIVHTNLGRSLLAEKVLEMFSPLSGHYTNLEYDLKKGKRGSRYVHVQNILKELTGAEDAMVVNNNAAAVLICLDTLARGREVVVSRGELVEIGGSFRIPEVMRKSGAKMVEVGTTNKTHLRDYEEVIGPETALLMKIHRSNFQIVGFTEEVDTKELVNLGRRYGIPVMEDLGSGCFVDLSKYGLTKEPTVQEALSAGVDIVSFSGDKLLGGPQAGIILGRKQLVDAVRKNQLNRALRIDKLTLLALEHTLRLYRDEQIAIREIPTLRMICQPFEELRRKARRLVRNIGRIETDNFTVSTSGANSKVGGGALPLLELPTTVVCLRPKKMSAHDMEEWFRAYCPPIICRVEKDELILDVRTILDDELHVVARAIREMASS